MSHTTGKLRVYFADSLRSWPGIDNGASKIVVHADVRGHRRSGVGGDTEEEVQANARRLVACWNACDGISTEELEAGAIQKLREQRDELIAALIAISDPMKVKSHGDPVVLRKFAMHAIAKAEGKPC